MTIKALNPYLNFDGTAKKAIALYESALGAKTERLMHFSDAKGMPVAPEAAQRVLHATLRLGGGLLMLSDTMPGMTLAKESNTHVSLDFDDVANMTKCFDALAASGKVTMPLQDTFWGARFGMLTDAFAIQWMFNHELKRA